MPSADNDTRYSPSKLITECSKFTKRVDFRQYLLSNFVMPFSYNVIQFSSEFFYAVSNPIIPFRILLFIFLILLHHYEFFYSVSNSVIRFRIMLCSFPILLFDCTVLSCSFESYYFLSNSVVLFSNSIMPLWILLFSFQFYSSKSGTSFIWPTAPWGPVTNWFPEYRKTWRTWTSTLCGIDYEHT